MDSDSTTAKYMRLIRDYTDGRKSASEFMHEYIQEFKKDGHETRDEVYEILNSVFFACDSYCHNTDPEKVKGGIDEDQFFKEAAYARRELEKLLNEDDDSGSK